MSIYLPLYPILSPTFSLSLSSHWAFHTITSFSILLRPSLSSLFLTTVFSLSGLGFSTTAPPPLLLHPLFPPPLMAPSWYSGLINCVYTAVNSYRCLAPANWSSGPQAPLMLPHARNADTHTGGILRLILAAWFHQVNYLYAVSLVPFSLSLSPLLPMFLLHLFFLLHSFLLLLLRPLCSDSPSRIRRFVTFHFRKHYAEAPSRKVTTIIVIVTR